MTSPVQSVSFNSTENWVGAGSKSGGLKVFDLDENKSQLLCLLLNILVHSYWHNKECAL